MLSARTISDRIAEVFPSAIVSRQDDGLHPHAVVNASHLSQVAAFVRSDATIALDMLRCITGLDYPDRKQMCVAYDLMSFAHRHVYCIKVMLDRGVMPELPHVPSVSNVWRAADWHERECFDMFGIVFDGHPDSVDAEPPYQGRHPRRILLPDDWVGFPLRKDYVFPREYHGIPGSVELDWAQKPEYPR